jgi:4-amino-4-deoxy-L-arabinose transferase-like glycosyltransferase
MSDRTRQLAQHGQLSERERAKVQDRFGMVLLLLIITVFFSISAPDGPWARVMIAVVSAVILSIAMFASGARQKVVWTWLCISGLGVGSSIIIFITRPGIAREDLPLTTLLLVLITLGAIARRLWLHAEISVLTVLGALCIYVLLGLSFALVFEVVGEFGSQPFFVSQETGTRSDYVYFSFTTMTTVGYGDLTPQGGLGGALAVTEGLLGQIYLVTAVAALVGKLGRTQAPLQESEEEALEEEDDKRSDGR